MADDTKGLKFWFNGVPVSAAGADTTGLKFWFNGAPVTAPTTAAVVQLIVSWQQAVKRASYW